MNPLADQLKTMGLRGAAAQLDDLVALATKKRWGATEILEHLATLEAKDRARRGLERRFSRSRLGRFKPMADYDWSWPTRIDRDAVEAALRLEFLERRGNLVLVAPQGLGCGVQHRVAPGGIAQARGMASPRGANERWAVREYDGWRAVHDSLSPPE
jgi:DNA replication protein DnaC